MIDRRPLQKFTYGMYIVSAKDGDRTNGQLSNTVFQVASEPPIISVCVNRQNVTHGMIARSGRFSVSILDITAPMELISVFGFRHGGEYDKFNAVPYRMLVSGAPIVTLHTNGFVEARVMASVEAATHTVFLGEVVDSGVFNEEASMTYEHYRRVLKGFTPKSAPTFSPAHAWAKEPVAVSGPPSSQEA